MLRVAGTGADAPAREQARTRALGLDAGVDEPMLLERIVRRDRVAFEALYRQYFPRVSRFVSRMLVRPQLVGEVVNDTMLVVWRRASRYNGQSRVSTWIFSIAYRTALHALRDVRDPIEALQDEASSTEAQGPEQGLVQAEDRRILDGALAHLRAEHRAVIELTYYQDCSCREISQILGCPVDTVKTRLFHARRHLRVMLAGRKGELR